MGSRSRPPSGPALHESCQRKSGLPARSGRAGRVLAHAVGVSESGTVTAWPLRLAWVADTRVVSAARAGAGWPVSRLVRVRDPEGNPIGLTT
jgi:hypothetical protein